MALFWTRKGKKVGKHVNNSTVSKRAQFFFKKSFRLTRLSCQRKVPYFCPKLWKCWIQSWTVWVVVTVVWKRKQNAQRAWVPRPRCLKILFKLKEKGSRRQVQKRSKVKIEGPRVGRRIVHCQTQGTQRNYNLADNIFVVVIFERTLDWFVIVKFIPERAQRMHIGYTKPRSWWCYRVKWSC